MATTQVSPPQHIKAEILLRTILNSICRKSPNITVRWSPEDREFLVQVGPEDQGRAVGKKGITYWAIRTILFWAGICQRLGPLPMTLLPPIGQAAIGKSAFKLNPEWNRGMIRDLLTMICDSTLNLRDNWELQETGEGEALVVIRIDSYLQPALTCPENDLPEAIKVLVHAAGMADGAVVKTQIVWT